MEISHWPSGGNPPRFTCTQSFHQGSEKQAGDNSVPDTQLIISLSPNGYSGMVVRVTPLTLNEMKRKGFTAQQLAVCPSRMDECLRSCMNTNVCGLK